MSIPNDTERRSVELSMTPMEALLALESFSIGAATMLVSERRGRTEMNVIQVMTDRLVEQTGLSPRVAHMLADGRSAVFRLVTRASKPETSVVAFRLERGDHGKVHGRIQVVVDGRAAFFSDLPLTKEEEAGITSTGFWERESEERAAVIQAFDAVVDEIVGFLRDEVHVGVEFHVEAPLAFDVPRRILAGRNEEAVRKAAEEIVGEAFQLDAGDEAVASISSDVWHDRDVVAVETRAVVPAVMRDDAVERLVEAVQVVVERRCLKGPMP